VATNAKPKRSKSNIKQSKSRDAELIRVDDGGKRVKAGNKSVKFSDTNREPKVKTGEEVTMANTVKPNDKSEDESVIGEDLPSIKGTHFKNGVIAKKSACTILLTRQTEERKRRAVRFSVDSRDRRHSRPFEVGFGER
jgi:hypothetical protein